MANRFVDEKDLRQIDLGDGDWIKIPSRLSYAMVSEIASLGDKDAGKTSTAFLLKVIREWNFTDAEGKGVAISEENLKRLDIATVKAIGEAIIPLIEPEKKV